MVTGHRTFGISEEQRDFTFRILPKVAKRLKDAYGMKEMISGMAIGADTIWADCAVELGVPLSAYIPFPQQSDKWSFADRSHWLKLRKEASKEIIIGEKFSIGLLHARNDAMIRASDLAVAVWSPSVTTGGTASAVNKIRKAKKPMILIDLDALTVTTERFKGDNNYE